MDTTEARSLLTTLSSQGTGYRSEVGTRDTIAYLKFWRDSDPDDFAVVTTPGANWYELAVRGGFAATHFDEDASDAEIAEILERYVTTAIAYLKGERTFVTSRVLKVPSVIVTNDGVPIALRLSLAGAAKAIFGFGRTRP